MSGSNEWLLNTPAAGIPRFRTRQSNSSLREPAPGVLKLASVHSRRGRRSYVTLRLPASVVDRVHRRLTVR